MEVDYGDPVHHVPALPPLEAKPILRLSPEVVNRIAAGEIIQRPVSALKELVENSLDAGATTISVTVKDGGNKLLQVQDNGVGIRFEDLPILCERHTTSKLAQFEDLMSISTFGFRGEALASISFVAHLTITTMVAGAPHAWRATYRDGVMEGPARPCAGVKGTTITVEDLFFNVVTRRKALKGAPEEYSKVLDVLGRYAARNAHASFSCRKQGEARADLHTAPAGDAREAIRAVFGTTVAGCLLPLNDGKPPDEEAGARSDLIVEGFISSANYAAKKMTFVLFINERLVECAPLKRACDAVYTALLPKADKPFVFLSLRLPPANVDVNVHPTKNEVLRRLESLCALIECFVPGPRGRNRKNTVPEIITRHLCMSLQRLVEEKLLASNSSRSFVTQSLLSGAVQPKSSQRDPTVHATGTTQREKAGGDHKLVRTDASVPQGRLDAFMRGRLGFQPEKQNQGAAGEEEPGECELYSVHSLLSEVEGRAHTGLSALCRQNIFVGLADAALAVVQHSTKLYLVNLPELTREMAYQQILRKFGKATMLRLETSAPIADLLSLGLDYEEACGRWTAESGDKTEAISLMLALLKEKAPMLTEYFSFSLEFQQDGGGVVLGLPKLVEQMSPDVTFLPQVLFALCHDVDWTEEKACFERVGWAISALYSVGKDRDFSNAAPDPGYEWHVQHVVFPAMRLLLKPPSSLFKDGHVMEIASLDKMYKIFERC